MFRTKPISFNTTTPKLPKIDHLLINGIVVNHLELSLGTIGFEILRIIEVKGIKNLLKKNHIQNSFIETIK
jgi:hypothetical protein